MVNKHLHTLKENLNICLSKVRSVKLYSKVTLHTFGCGQVAELRFQANCLQNRLSAAFLKALKNLPQQLDSIEDFQL